MHKICIDSPFACFVDIKALQDEIYEIPERKEKCEEAKQRYDEILDKIKDAYVKFSAAKTAGTPFPYYMLAEGVLFDNTLKPFDEAVPLLENVTVNVNLEGVDYAVSLEKAVFSDPNDKSPSKQNLTVLKFQQSTPRNLMVDLAELMRDMSTLSQQAPYIYVDSQVVIPCPGHTSPKEMEAKIKAIVNKYIAEAEKRAHAWLAEISEYADPNGLFGCMI